MKYATWIFVVTMASLFWIPGSAEGHHGYAAFDTRVALTFVGTVSEFHWTNPHCVVDFDVKDAQGQVRTWHGELSSPVHLVPRGWTAATLESGDKITVTGYPGKNNVPSIWVTKILLPDGKELKAEAEK
jgi:hypothetical protein